MLEEVVDFLPSELDPHTVREAVLIGRTFDRAHGQLLFVARRDGTRAVLSRPSDFELFREIPCDHAGPFAVLRDEGGPRVEVRVVDGKTLRMGLEVEEAARLEGLVRVEVLPPPRPAGGPPASERPRRPSDLAPHRKTSRPPPRESYREPQSAEAEVVHVRAGLLRPGATPLPPGDELPASLRPTAAALAAARGEPVAEGERDSVRPPALSEELDAVVPGPRDVVALRALLHQHWERGALDEASQVARALVFLGSGEPVEKRLAALQPEGAPSPARPIASHLFQAYLAHDEEEPDLARFCSALWPALLTMRLRAERDMGLRRTDEIDLASPPPGFARCFQSAARSLALPQVRLWIRADVAGGLAHLNVSPVGSLCGRSLTSGFAAEEMLFVAAHHLSLYRPEVYLLALLPAPSDVLTLACAGLHLERRMPPDPRVVKLAETLERFMVPQVRESLRVANAALALPGDPRTALADGLGRLRRGAHLSAARAGFFLSGSLPVAARMLRLMPPQPGLAVDEVIDDLVSFSISPACAALRREVGFALAPSSPGASLP
jgi:hypothetical protein